VITDANIREYLLGRLDSESELVDNIDEQILTDPSFSLTVDVVEDEIIEEYLEGSLSSEDARAVERHFLRPSERQRKLEIARLLGRYFEAESRKAKAKQQAKMPGVFNVSRWARLFPNFRTCTEIAAAMVFVVAIVSLVNQRRQLDVLVKRANQELAQERDRLAAANQQLQSALQATQPAIAMLNLVRPGVQRGIADLPEVKVNSATKTLHVEVALLSRAPGKYRVQLRHAGMTAWYQDGVDVASVPGGAILKVDIPAVVLPQGPSELTVADSSGVSISYWFVIAKVQ
jgi:hypothetical protein